jgi:calpain-15
VDIISNIFNNNNEISEEGCYQIRLCQEGLWKNVFIDDFLPCSPNGNLICSKTNRKQLWLSLLEKALAKLAGNFENLAEGNTLEGFSLLTGYLFTDFYVNYFLL